MVRQRLGPPSEYAGFNVYSQNLPFDLRDAGRDHLSHIYGLFLDNVPAIRTIDEIVLLPIGRGWRYGSADKGVRTLVYGTFRSEFKIIVSMAEMLADYYAETLFSPVVVPVTRKVWRENFLFDNTFLRNLNRYGITTFVRRYHG